MSSIHNYNLNSTKWFAYPLQLLQTKSLVHSRIKYDRVNFGVFDRIAMCTVVYDVSVNQIVV